MERKIREKRYKITFICPQFVLYSDLLVQFSAIYSSLKNYRVITFIGIRAQHFMECDDYDKCVSNGCSLNNI